MAAIAAFGFATKAQNFGFQKGDVILEGAIGVSTSDNKTTELKTSSINFSPSVGYFVTDKVAVGLNLGYGESKTTNYSGSTDSYTKTNSIAIGVFGRYYFLDLGERFKAYSQAAIGYNQMGGESNNGTVTIKNDKVNSFGIGAGIGANYFLTKKMAIGYQFANVINFSSSKVDKSGAKATNSFNLNLNSFSNFFNSGQFSLTFKL